MSGDVAWQSPTKSIEFSRACAIYTEFREIPIQDYLGSKKHTCLSEVPFVDPTIIYELLP